MLTLDVGCGSDKKGDVGIDVEIEKDFEVDINADALSLPFRDGVFSKVISSHNLEHLENPKKALSEQFRVLHDGGKLRFIIPRKAGIFYVFLHWHQLGILRPKNMRLWRNQKRYEGWRHKYQFSKEWLEKTLKEIGFSDVEVLDGWANILHGRKGRILSKFMRARWKTIYFVRCLKNDDS